MIEVILLSAICYLFKILPFRIIYILSDVTAWFIHYIIGYRKSVVIQNLRAAFPDKSDKERRNIAKRYYHIMCDYIAEALKGFSLSKNQLSKRVTTSNTNVFSTLFKQKKPVVVVLSHHGNWEWAALASNLISEHRIAIVYKKISNKQVEAFTNGIRKRFGAELVEMKSVLRHFLQHRDDEIPYCYILVADQKPSNKMNAYWTHFLNQETGFITGPEKLSRRFGASVVWTDIKLTKRGFYNLDFELLFDNAQETEPAEVSEAIVRKIENQIIQQPDYWLWSHRRWKSKKPSEWTLEHVLR